MKENKNLKKRLTYFIMEVLKIVQKTKSVVNRSIVLLFAAMHLIYINANAQESRSKDTLFFKYNKSYIRVYDVTPENFYLKDSSKDETFFFKEIEIKYDLNTGKVLDLKKFIRTSEFYDKKRKYRKLDDFGLSKSLKDYVIFLVKKEGKTKKYIKVYPLTEIE